MFSCDPVPLSVDLAGDLPSVIVRDPIVVRPETSIRSAIEALANRQAASWDPSSETGSPPDPHRRVSCVLVQQNGQLVGIVTAGDVIRWVAQGRSLDDAIADLMSQPVHRLQESQLENPWLAEALFQQYPIRHLPIVDAAGSLTGLLTRAALRSRLPSTQLAHVAQALEQNQRRLASLAAAVPVGLFHTDAAGHCLYVNERWCYLAGMLPEAALGQGWVQGISPDDRAIVLREWRAATQAQRPFRLEYRFQRPDGQMTWVYGQAVAEYGEDGQVVGYVGTVTDISDRKQAEAERLQAEKTRLELNLLERILDVVLAGYWDWHIPSGQEYLSPGFKQMFGYADHELPNCPESWQNLIFPEDLPDVLNCFDRHVQSHGQVPYYNEVRYRHRDGSTVWVICSGQVIEWDGAGNPVRMIGCHIDITQRKQAEEQLRKRDTHLKAAQRLAQLGSWEFHVPTQSVTWSDEVFRIFGCDPAAGPPNYEQLLGFYHPDDRAYHHEVVQTALATGQPYEFEARLCRADGSLRYVQVRGEPGLDEAGQLVHLLGTVLDITDRKQAEAKLLQTKAQLETSNHELEAFAYSVSHDLRAPLRAIDGFSQALLEEYGHLVDEAGQDYFDRIRKNVHRMGWLIDDLLSLSRVSRVELRPVPVNLSHLAEEVIQELQASEPDRQVDYVIAPETIVPADPHLMRIALTNLLHNAWKFTSHHPTARIEFGRLPHPEAPVYFIRDDGAGFDMTYAKMLFGVFQRLHNTQEFPGTGIGLATVQRIIHRHGGQVWAEGAIEQGATFYFTLPQISLTRGA